MKGWVLKGTLLTVLLSAWGAHAMASSGVGVTADEALKRLMDGNARFVESKMTTGALCDVTAREKLAKGQKPYAIVLSCSDSRVPPELIFDQGLGEIFVVRDAGNVTDQIVLGSIEYAAEHIGSPLIVVLGHERCGAVTATVDANGKGEGNIGAIVKAIAPSLKKVKGECCKNHKGCDKKDKAKLIECVVDMNARMVAANLVKQSKVIAELVKEGKVRIVAAKYDLDDGKVTLFEDKK
jgi:carbonic anhydrase